MPVGLELDNRASWSSDFINIPIDSYQMTNSQALGEVKKNSCAICCGNCIGVMVNT